MIVHELASAVYNDIVAGLVGVVSNPTISMEQLELDIVDERLYLIKELISKDVLQKKDMYMSITCIKVDCQSMNKCCESGPDGLEMSKLNSRESAMHFEIPLLLNDFGEEAISYVGSTNNEVSFKVYTDRSYLNHKYRMVGKDRPYVYIDTTPNANNMYDGWIFNAPMVQYITVVGIFKDLRQVEEFSCCINDLRNMSFIDSQIKLNVTAKKLQYYRTNYMPPQPNNQIPR